MSFTYRQGPVAAFLTWNVHRQAHQDKAPIRFNLPVASGVAPESHHSVEDGFFKLTLPGDSGTLTFPMARPGAPVESVFKQRILHV